MLDGVAQGPDERGSQREVETSQGQPAGQSCEDSMLDQYISILTNGSSEGPIVD